jgi:hypothetical protein
VSFRKPVDKMATMGRARSTPSREKVLDHPRVERDERSRERPLPEQVLDGVGGPQRRPEDVGVRPDPEVVGERELADEADEPRGEDAEGDQTGAAAAGRLGRRGNRLWLGGRGIRTGLGGRRYLRGRLGHGAGIVPF